MLTDVDRCLLFVIGPSAPSLRFSTSLQGCLHMKQERLKSAYGEVHAELPWIFKVDAHTHAHTHIHTHTHTHTHTHV